MATATKPTKKFGVAEAVRPLYAGVGAAEAAAETVASFVKKQYSDVTTQVEKGQSEVKSLREQAIGKFNEGVKGATELYGDFAKRGETVVAKVRKSEPVAKVTEPVAKVVAEATETIEGYLPKKAEKKAPAKKAAPKRATTKATKKPVKRVVKKVAKPVEAVSAETVQAEGSDATA